jgi:hypothetical protein
LDTHDTEAVASANAINSNIEYDMQLKKIREEVLKKFDDYRQIIGMMAADAPLGILCLPKKLEGILLDNGLNRVYDLFNCDFAEIKGLNDTSIGKLTASLEQFTTML